MIFSLFRKLDEERGEDARMAVLRALASTEEPPTSREVVNMVHPSVCEGGVVLTEREARTVLVGLAKDRLINRSKGRKTKHKTWWVNENGREFLKLLGVSARAHGTSDT